MKLIKWLRNASVLLPAIVMVVINIVAGLWLTNAVTSALLREKMVEKRLDLDLICVQIDDYVERDKDWGIYDYGATLRKSMEYLDAQPMTYAGVFTEDLQDISIRTESYAGSPFEPMLCEDFVAAVNSADSGDCVQSFTPHGEKPRDMHIYFRWVPADSSLTGRYLTIVAISKYSVTVPVSTRVAIVMSINIITALVCVVWYGIKSVELGHIRKLRKGEPWRGELYEE